MSETPRIEELKRRVQSDPASIAFAALAEEYRRAGSYEEAIATCTAGLHRHPSYLSAHVTLGRALIEVGRFEEAREELEQVLKLAPENLAAIRGLAEIHNKAGEAAQEQYAAAGAARYEADAEHAASATLPEERAASGAIAGPAAAPLATSEQSPTPAGMTDPGPAPFLAGLEAFLLAIQRARSERAGDR